MKTTTLFTERMSQAFTPGPTGFVKLVDDLLEISRDWDLKLDWNEVCRVQTGRDTECESFEAPMRLGEFRAVLARLAKLCNDHVAESVSPYGGEGTVSIGEPPVQIAVSLGNSQANGYWATIRRA